MAPAIQTAGALHQQQAEQQINHCCLVSPSTSPTSSNSPTNSSNTDDESDSLSGKLFRSPIVLRTDAAGTGHPSAFQRMLDNLDNVFDRNDKSVDVDELWRVLEEYYSNPAEWSQFAYYDQMRYKRNLVAEHEKFNVMIICWAPRAKSCIHDHSGSHCFMKLLDGELAETRFAWPDPDQLEGSNKREMCRTAVTKMGLNNVFYINDKVGLHLVENTSMNKTAASLHVYIPPYRSCKLFDERTGQARDCQINFYSKCGRIVPDENSS